MVADPAAWGWLVGTWIVMRVREHVSTTHTERLNEQSPNYAKNVQRQKLAYLGAGERIETRQISSKEGR